MRPRWFEELKRDGAILLLDLPELLVCPLALFCIPGVRQNRVLGALWVLLDEVSGMSVQKTHERIANRFQLFI